jgi:K+-sensing histidine kinase KdpD
LAEEKSQQLEIVAGQLTVRADRELLRLALLNLVHNAIRYSAEGLVISLRIQRRDANAVVEVVDQGPGIAPEHQKKFLTGFTVSIRRDRVLVEVQVSAWPSRAGRLNDKGGTSNWKAN